MNVVEFLTLPAERYKEARESMGLKGYQVADATGISRQTISTIENGHNTRVPARLKLAKFYGICPELADIDIDLYI